MKISVQTTHPADLIIHACNAAEDHTPAWNRLTSWQQDGIELGFVYARALGGLVQTGRGKIASLADTALTIDARQCHLVVLLSGAQFEKGPQMFFDPTLSGAFHIEGVAIQLANHDWLFFSEETIPPGLASNATSDPPALPTRHS